MYNEIFIAGSGGQGVLSLGRILVMSAVEENKYVTYYPSYGAEVRGGTANCMVKISDEPIYSPVIEHPTEMVIMNTPSYLKFIKKFLPQKILFLNTSLVEENEEITRLILTQIPQLEIIRVNATEIANKIGNILSSNMVMLGSIVQKLKIISVETVKTVLGKIFDEKILELNLQAFIKGMESLK